MPFSVRSAKDGDIGALADIEVEARTRFTDTQMSEELRGYRMPESELRACQYDSLLWVAEPPDHGVVAFLAAQTLEKASMCCK